MIKKSISLFLMFIFLISGFLNYKVFRSFIDQAFLLYEFNAYQLNLPSEAIESFNVDFPNITVTTIPMKTLKARYLMRDSAVTQSIELLHQSRKDNQFLGISEFELSKYYFNNKSMDSALYYSKIAFEALPRNALLSRLYFQVLTKLKKDSLLDESFNKIKEYNNVDQLSDYLFSKLEIGKTTREELGLILKSYKNRIPNSQQFSTIKTLINIGSENLSDYGKIIIDAETLFAKEKFNEAANLYDMASRLDPSEYTHYENAALSYYKGNSLDNAERLFKKTMRTFNPKTGKVEFYYGLLMYEKNEKQDACKFWNISKEKGFLGSQRVIDTFCK